MNTQHKSTTKLLKILFTALMLVTLVYSSLPALPVYATAFVVNEAGDDPDPVLDGLCDINPVTPTLDCTLRAALMEANVVDDLDVITFDTNYTLFPATAYPTITQPVTIDGNSPGGMVTIDGNGGTFIGFNVQASNVTITGLSIIDFDGTAIRVSNGADGVIINSNYIGVETDGETDGQNTDKGIRVIDSPNVSITDNLISGNDLGGILVSGAASNGASITGNTIGLNAAGDALLEDTPTIGADGIRLTDVTNATIGGGSTSARNFIAGNYGNGIVITGVSTGTSVSNNHIGTSAIGEDPIPNLTSGIRLTSADGVSIGIQSGNLISGNSAPGIVVSTSTNGIIQNNVIGLDVDGDTAIPNTSYGINVSGSSDFSVSGNTISGNTGSGMRMANGTTGFHIYNNRIGVGQFADINLGNTNHGIYIDNSNDNMIGDALTSQGNVIAYNISKGIYIANTNFPTYNSYGNTIVSNSIFNNGDLGIDLFPSGPTANDAGDPDGGPNYLQNYPTFTAKQTATGVQITGELNTDPARPNYRIEFFTSNSCDASGYGEGAELVDVLDISITAAVTPIDYEIPDTSIGVGEFITATVTYDEGTGGLKDTSEFSPCAVVQEPDSPGSSGVFVVNSTADTAETGGQIGDGFCNVGGGECTLRAAIQEANAGTEPPYTISFNIAGTEPHRIGLSSALPTLNTPVLIKGKNAGYSGPPVIEIDGSGAGAVSGLVPSVTGITIDGLSIINFTNSAIQVNADGIIISNNYLGLEADGTTIGGNQVGVSISGFANNMVRNNVISGNFYGVRLTGSSTQTNTIRNNYIGTDSGGSVDKGNTNDGISIQGSPNNLIEQNTISGNNGDGIEVSGGATGNRIFSNNIGVFSNGSGSLGNSGNGVNINTASENNLIANSNTIRNNGASGVYVSAGNGNLISTNSISNNGTLGIQLASGGNNATPAPILTSASNGGNYVLIEGQLNGMQPNTTYTVELFSNVSGGLQGEAYIFSTLVTTNGAGSAVFTAGPLVSVPNLTPITATATDPSDNTSQFSGAVYVIGTAPTLTPSPTFTPTATLNAKPSPTPIPTSTNTPVASNTPVPTNTPTGGGGGPTAVVNTATPSKTPTITPTATLLSQFQTLTALATENTIEPSETPSTPTSTLVPSNTPDLATDTPTVTLVPTEVTGAGGDEPIADGTGGGGLGGDDLIGDLFGGGGFSTILWIFIGLALILLIVGGAMELMRWLNSRGD